MPARLKGPAWNAGATFTKGHFKSTAGDLFKLTNINIFSTSLTAQTITITAYKAGVRVSGSTISISTSSTAAHNLTTADFDSYYNAMEENVAYYAPQYSRNGIDFTDAGKITDLNQDHIYSYRMPLSFTGNMFCRVLEVDLDGMTVSRQTMPMAFPVKIPLTGLASGTCYIYCTDDKQRRSTAIPFVKIPE